MINIKAEDVKVLSDKYISKSGVVFRLVEMPFGPFRRVLGISKAGIPENIYRLI